jgi:hypothetical protein
MNTKTLSQKALSIIDSYLHFRIGGAVCSVPYFNNKVKRTRAALRVNIGKGSIDEITDEVSSFAAKNRIPINSIADESLKKILTDNNIGIDCSGFSYYILNAESLSRGRGVLDKYINFIRSKGIIGRIRSSMRPVENCDVYTLADNNNSHDISLQNISPGDIITMIGGPDNNDRDHILVVHQVDYDAGQPKKIYYSHAVSYPEDGLYGNGIKQGYIEMTKPSKSILDQNWVESGQAESARRIVERAQKSKTEIRRLNNFE